MSEEVPFKSLKITLSDEAIAKLGKLRLAASLRSDSATIEECIRVLYEVVLDVYTESDKASQRALESGQEPHVDEGIVENLFQKMLLRLDRFVPSSETMKRVQEKYPWYRNSDLPEK